MWLTFKERSFVSQPLALFNDEEATHLTFGNGSDGFGLRYDKTVGVLECVLTNPSRMFENFNERLFFGDHCRIESKDGNEFFAGMVSRLVVFHFRN